MALGLLALALGAAVGVVLALTGAGGGILAVPLLVFGLGLSVAQAAPVGLIAVGAASALGAALGWRAGQVRYRAAALIGAAGLAAAPLGLQLAQVLPERPLTLAFAAVLGLVAWRTFGQARGVPALQAPPPRPCSVGADRRLAWTGPCAALLAATGALAGLLTGLLGVGGGFVIVPALTRLTPLPPRSIVATSLAVIALVSVGGAGAAVLHGRVDPSVALPFATGALGALVLGRRWARALAGPRLQQIFASASGVVALLLVARAAAAWGPPA